MISTQKASRYTAGQLIALNRKKESDYSRECRVCRRIESVDENGLCPHCSALKELSGKILNEKYAFFTILSEKEDNALELPLGYYLVAEDEKELQKRMLWSTGVSLWNSTVILLCHLKSNYFLEMMQQNEIVLLKLFAEKFNH